MNRNALPYLFVDDLNCNTINGLKIPWGGGGDGGGASGATSEQIETIITRVLTDVATQYDPLLAAIRSVINGVTYNADGTPLGSATTGDVLTATPEQSLGLARLTTRVVGELLKDYPGDIEAAYVAQWTADSSGTGIVTALINKLYELREEVTALQNVEAVDAWSAYPGNATGGHEYLITTNNTYAYASGIYTQTPAPENRRWLYTTSVGNTGVGVDGDTATAAQACTAIGRAAKCHSDYSIAIGGAIPNPLSPFTVADESKTHARSPHTIAVGLRTEAEGDSAVAIGRDAKATRQGAVCIGRNARAQTGSGGVAVGESARAVGSHGVAVGNSAEAADASSAYGVLAKAEQEYSVALGYGARSANSAVAVGSYRIGVVPQTYASGLRSVAVGYSTRAQAEDSTAVGAGALARDERSIAIGRFADAIGTASIAMGHAARTAAANQVALGIIANDSARGLYADIQSVQLQNTHASAVMNRLTPSDRQWVTPVHYNPTTKRLVSTASPFDIRWYNLVPSVSVLFGHVQVLTRENGNSGAWSDIHFTFTPTMYFEQSNNNTTNFGFESFTNRVNMAFSIFVNSLEGGEERHEISINLSQFITSFADVRGSAVCAMKNITLVDFSLAPGALWMLAQSSVYVYRSNVDSGPVVRMSFFTRDTGLHVLSGMCTLSDVNIVNAYELH